MLGVSSSSSVGLVHGVCPCWGMEQGFRFIVADYFLQ